MVSIRYFSGVAALSWTKVIPADRATSVKETGGAPGLPPGLAKEEATKKMVAIRTFSMPLNLKAF
jgi:hypothetical protein